MKRGKLVNVCKLSSKIKCVKTFYPRCNIALIFVSLTSVIKLQPASKRRIKSQLCQWCCSNSYSLYPSFFSMAPLLLFITILSLRIEVEAVIFRCTCTERGLGNAVGTKPGCNFLLFLYFQGHVSVKPEGIFSEMFATEQWVLCSQPSTELVLSGIASLNNPSVNDLHVWELDYAHTIAVDVRATCSQAMICNLSWLQCHQKQETELCTCKAKTTFHSRWKVKPQFTTSCLASFTGCLPHRILGQGGELAPPSWFLLPVSD